jgi:hypothetical protein
MTPAHHLVMALLAAAVCLASLAAGYRYVVGTTLRACWMWCLVSLLMLTAASVAILGPVTLSDAVVSHIRHAAAITTFCPLMAILGAKRPQDRAWQFIVLSLWVVLMLPSGVSLAWHPEAKLTLHGARQWFLAILIAVELFNGVATRFWPSALGAAAAQVLLLAPFLPWLDEHAATGLLAGPGVYSLALALLAGACALRAAGWPRPAQSAEPLDRLWLDFRDCFGAVWGLRVAERLSATARLAGWPLRLGWNGFAVENGAAEPGSLSPETHRAVEKAMRPLMRRFVSSDWIVQRLDAESAIKKPQQEC